MSSKLENGRSSYEELKRKYERVLIKHVREEDGTARSICLLVSGGKVHVGLAKFSDRGDSFQRSKGRIIAQGRAELAASVDAGETIPRVSLQKRREELSFTITASEHITVQEVINNFIGSNEK